MAVAAKTAADKNSSTNIGVHGKCFLPNSFLSFARLALCDIKNAANPLLSSRDPRTTMVIYDLWHADDGYSVQGEELDGDVLEWPAPTPDKCLTLRLEELTHFDLNIRIQARARNFVRLEKAKQREDIKHLDVHYTCCIDRGQREAIEDLLSCDQRKWTSFTMHAINGFTDFYTRPAPLEDLSELFFALRSVQILNLYSCPWYRGHGLDAILKLIPLYENLQELRLQGWQMDRVSVNSLVEAFNKHSSNKLRLLSLRSCAFLGERVFFDIVDVLSGMSHLRTLNISYCNLHDSSIVYVVQQLRCHQSLYCLHIGGNDCVSSVSVQAVADWLRSKTCQLKDLNLRALWVAYSDEGLLQRQVDLSVLYEAIRCCPSLQRLGMSENYLEDVDIKRLTSSVRNIKALSHLDVGDNPFTEEGASSLLSLVKMYPSLESIRFENVYIPYISSDAIRTQATVNFFDNRLSRAHTPVPLALWSKIMMRFQQYPSDILDTTDVSHDLIYHFLKSTTGDFGLPLSFRIVTETE